MKKSTLIIQLPKKLILLFILLLFSSPVMQAQVVIGDPDSSGSIDIIDALIVAQYYVGLDPDNFNEDAADVNCSSSIDIVDALLIAQHYVGLVSEFTDCAPTPAPTPVPPDDKYLELIQRWASEQDIDLTGYEIVQIGNEASDYILPGYTFFLLYLIQYPVAYGPPDEQLGTNSLVVIDTSLTITLLPDENYLSSFYRQYQVPITTEEERKLAIKAWLILSQEYKNDGYYTFHISDDDITIEYIVADYIEYRITGISRVIAGGEGLIKATATIGVDGMLAYVDEEFELIPGARPICQSTKLLDKDPVVRKMAEQDLLAMGYSAEDYLAAQRAKASPELKQAIDRIWERILLQEEKRNRIFRLLSGLPE